MAAEPQPAPPASDAGQNSASAAPGSGPAPDRSEQPTFTQAQVEALIKDRLDRQQRALTAQQEQTRKEAEDRALTEQGAHKERADKLASEVDRLKAEVAARDLAALKARIAKKHGIEEFADRLNGQTEDEIDADAKAFAAALPKAAKPAAPG